MPTEQDKTAILRRHVADLLDVVEDIALIADGHRRSTAVDADGNNIALSVILGLAAGAIGKADRLRETGTIFTPPGTTVA